jgi:phenylacetate-coenzyme A ligase PaaK-like adenylate-forming protein
MRRMEKVTGRSDDMIIIRGVNVFPTQVEDAMAWHLTSLSSSVAVIGLIKCEY